MSDRGPHPFAGVKGVNEFFVMPLLDATQAAPTSDKLKAVELRTIFEWKSLLGGEEGSIVDPLTGVVHPVNLRHWNSLNENTQLVFEFKFTPDKE